MIKNFNEFINESNIDELTQYIEQNKATTFLEDGLFNPTINTDGTINVDGVRFQNENWKEFPKFIKFNECRGDFIIRNCALTKLNGPKKVYGKVEISDSDIVSLENGPISVMGDFYVYKNRKLNNIKGFPKEIDGNIDFGDNGKSFTKEEVVKICKINDKKKIRVD